MNRKPTLFLMALAAGLFAYIYFVERDRVNPEDRAALAKKMFPDLDAAKVRSVEILRSNALVRVERVGDQWRMSQPAYPAQSTPVENWVALLASLPRRAHVSAGELQAQSGGLQAFGLDSPQVSVTVEHGAGRLQLRLGARTPVGEQLYLQIVGSDGVYVTDAALLDALPRSAADWRDTTFVDLAGLKFDRLQVRSGNREFEVQRNLTNQAWRLTKPRSARADHGSLLQLLQQLQLARVGQFVSELPGGDLGLYGLQPPEVTLSLSLGTNEVLSIDFGSSPTNDPGVVFASRRSHYPGVVTVTTQAVALLRAPYTEFIERRLVEFAADALTRIEVRAAESFALQKQTNGVWRGVEPLDFPADPALVKVFLDRLNALQIVDIAKEVVPESDLPSFGLAPPVRQYVLKAPQSATGTNRVVAQIEFGTNQAERVFVRRTDETSVYTVTLEDALQLPRAAFELRDRRIWNFTTNQVGGVAISFKGQTTRLTRNKTGQWGVATNSQGIVHNTFALDEAMFRFGRLWARYWVARGDFQPARYGFADPPDRLAVEIANGGKPQIMTVDFGGPSPSGGPFAAVELDGARMVFECPFEIFHVYNEVLRNLTPSVNAPP